MTTPREPAPVDEPDQATGDVTDDPTRPGEDAEPSADPGENPDATRDPGRPDPTIDPDEGRVDASEGDPDPENSVPAG